jgi:hypothetical protein
MVKVWNLEPKRAPLYKNELLVKKVTELWHYNLGHKEILQILNREDCPDRQWPEVTNRALKELRLQCKLLYSNRGVALEQAQLLAQEYVRKHLETGQAARYGIVYTHTNIRLAENTFVSQHQVRRALRAVDPVGVQARTQHLQRQRGRYVLKGPNEVWSVDGHDKLADFGFEIYGFLDAYSRFVLGVYVGISNRTAISVQKQYLEVVQRYGFPKLIRSDHGTETVLMAQTQLLFRRELEPDLPFSKAYAYGTSTKNQRIEAWWNLMATGQTEQWKILFETYRETGLFDGSKYDKIALQFLYMPVIRHQIHQFVWVHNTHAIRRQRNREFYLPTGKPYKLYNHPPPNVQNYATFPSSALMTELQFPFLTHDSDAYLTGETMALCIQLLTEAGYPLQFNFAGQDNTHQKAYAYLRTALYMYEQTTGIIKELEHPLGAQSWLDTHREQNMILLQTLGEAEDNVDLPLTNQGSQEGNSALIEGTSVFQELDFLNSIIEWPAEVDGLEDDFEDNFGDDGLLLNL